MDYLSAINSHFEESARVKKLVINHCSQAIEKTVIAVADSLKNGGKILICGNGGSAADAQHIAAEFVIRLSHEFERPALPAIALTTDTSVLTAGSNDLGFDRIFARQIEAFGQAGDVLIAITTSGNSSNILKAINLAKTRQVKTVAFLGNNGGKCKTRVDIPIVVPSTNTQHIQEAHIAIGHILVELVEKTLFKS